MAHTHVLQEGPVTGKAADVLAAANTAAEVALRLVRPGKKVITCTLLILLLCLYMNLFIPYHLFYLFLKVIIETECCIVTLYIQLMSCD